MNVREYRELQLITAISSSRTEEQCYYVEHLTTEMKRGETIRLDVWEHIEMLMGVVVQGASGQHLITGSGTMERQQHASVMLEAEGDIDKEQLCLEWISVARSASHGGVYLVTLNYRWLMPSGRYKTPSSSSLLYPGQAARYAILTELND